MLVDYMVKKNRFTYSTIETIYYFEPLDTTVKEDVYVQADFWFNYLRYPKVLIYAVNPMYPILLQLLGIVDISTNRIYCIIGRNIGLNVTDKVTYRTELVFVNPTTILEMLSLNDFVRIKEENAYGNLDFFNILKIVLNSQTYTADDVIGDVDVILSFVSSNLIDFNFRNLIAAKNYEFINKIPNYFEFQGNVNKKETYVNMEPDLFYLIGNTITTETVETVLSIEADDFYCELVNGQLMNVEYLIRDNILFTCFDPKISISDIDKELIYREIFDYLNFVSATMAANGILVDRIVFQKNCFGEVSLLFYQNGSIMFRLNLDFLAAVCFPNYFSEKNFFFYMVW